MDKQIYIMSDVHGEYELFKKMLEKIKFKKDDLLYVIGDVIDRGPDGIELLKYIMEKENIVLIKGNHEQMMCDSVIYSDDFKNEIDKDDEKVKDAVLFMLDWLRNVIYSKKDIGIISSLHISFFILFKYVFKVE